MKSKRKVCLLIVIICILLIGGLYFSRDKKENTLLEHWDIHLSDTDSSIYKKYPEASFHNDGVYYEVFAWQDHSISIQEKTITFVEQKDEELEKEFLQYTQESEVIQEQIPDFSKEYQYYAKKEQSQSLLMILQNQKLYVVSYL